MPFSGSVILIHGPRLLSGLGPCAAFRVERCEAVNEFAEDHMFVVEPRGGRHGDEKLAAVRVLAGVGHRQDARTVMLEVGMKLVRQKVAGVSGSVALRALGLL